MADMMTYATKGWVKLMRSFIDSRSFDNANATAAYTHCLLRANYASRIVKGITLERGQFITSNAQFAEECGLTDKEMRNAFKMLEDDGLIKREPVPSRANGGASNRANNRAKNGTLVTVVNYDDIGIPEEDEGEQWGERQGEQQGNSIRIRIKKEEKENNKDTRNVNRDRLTDLPDSSSYPDDAVQQQISSIVEFMDKSGFIYDECNGKGGIRGLLGKYLRKGGIDPEAIKKAVTLAVNRDTASKANDNDVGYFIRCIEH